MHLCRLICLFLTLLMPVAWAEELVTTDRQDAKTLIFANVLSESSFRYKWYRYVYSEAFLRLGFNFEIRSYPMKRAPYLVNEGLLDGELGRVGDFNTAYPNLIRVNEPIWSGRFIAYSRDPDLKLDGWESLIESGLRVNYRRGMKKTEELLPTLLPETDLQYVTTDTQGLLKLIKGRTDIYIGIESIVGRLIKDGQFNGFTVYQSGVMEQSSIYTFLHKRHEKLAVDLARTFRDMKDEGLFELYDQLAAE